ncbi:hypothetical protein [Enterovibrio coralii]|uniref:Lipoprotein n=1 Tax=Enterovibrio coralii TaxID=294935 RepID=A0A135ICJ3_9GAMM|nr:hypothetical protein [Enterovibrio coralii]KXF83159.1 hypothetical protein ATN88_05515 [Enterovibrio coralii]
MKIIVIGIFVFLLSGCLNLPEKQVWVDGNFNPVDEAKLDKAKKKCGYDVSIPNLVAMLEGKEYDEEEAKKEIELTQQRSACMEENGFYREDESKVNYQ